MRRLLPLGLLVLAALAVVSLPPSTQAGPALTTDASVVFELVPAPTCSALVTWDKVAAGDLPNNCEQSFCDKTCWLQGYDYGVCLASVCYCRFYL